MKLSARFLGVTLLIGASGAVRASDDLAVEAPHAHAQAETSSEPRANLRRAQGTVDIIVILHDDDDTRARHLNQGKRPEIAAANKAKAGAVAKGLGVQADFTYGMATFGFSAKGVTKAQKDAIEASDAVAYVEEDLAIQLDDIEMEAPGNSPFSRHLRPPPGKGPGSGGGGDSSPPPQTTPWGINRVNGGATYTGSGAAYIVDTGIDLDHPDLNVDTSRGYNAFTSGKDGESLDDGNGHGTHVAGTVAAMDNNEGVIGVAAGATVVAVKVLNRRGSGSYSGVIAGIDYVGANCESGDAANMSLGGGFSAAVNNAVIAASSACPFALAAGNESTHAGSKSPASANGNNIYTVSSMTSSDRLSSFSNYGNPPVDCAAPGSSVYSTYKNGGYATLSGTSMAAPHVCGILLLGQVRSGGTLKTDRDSSPDMIAVH